MRVGAPLGREGVVDNAIAPKRALLTNSVLSALAGDAQVGLAARRRGRRAPSARPPCGPCAPARWSSLAADLASTGASRASTPHRTADLRLDLLAHGHQAAAGDVAGRCRKTDRTAAQFAGLSDGGFDRVARLATRHHAAPSDASQTWRRLISLVSRDCLLTAISSLRMRGADGRLRQRADCTVARSSKHTTLATPLASRAPRDAGAHRSDRTRSWPRKTTGLPFPHDAKAYAYAGDALKKAWPKLHAGDCEPFPDDKRAAALLKAAGKAAPKLDAASLADAHCRTRGAPSIAAISRPHSMPATRSGRSAPRSRSRRSASTPPTWSTTMRRSSSASSRPRSWPKPRSRRCPTRPTAITAMPSRWVATARA